MKTCLWLFYELLHILVSPAVKQDDFKSSQKKFSRVRAAYAEKGDLITTKLKEVDIDINDLNILIVAYKTEGLLELWVKPKKIEEYKLLETYKICKSSGKLGPKRKQRDYQVPEGFYIIDRYNPASSFHLSLGINYPNKSDKIKSKFIDPGSDIFIHGECETVGCLPMTNDKIKEIYLFAVEAKNAGQDQIPVYIFPSRLNESAYNNLKNKFNNNPELINLWSSLKAGYDQFVASKKAINYYIGDNGDYLIGEK